MTVFRIALILMCLSGNVAAQDIKGTVPLSGTIKTSPTQTLEYTFPKEDEPILTLNPGTDNMPTYPSDNGIFPPVANMPGVLQLNPKPNLSIQGNNIAGIHITDTLFVTTKVDFEKSLTITYDGDIIYSNSPENPQEHWGMLCTDAIEHNQQTDKSSEASPVITGILNALTSVYGKCN